MLFSSENRTPSLRPESQRNKNAFAEFPANANLAVWRNILRLPTPIRPDQDKPATPSGKLSMKQLLRSIAPSALYPLVFLLLGLSAWAQTTIMPMGDSGTVGVDYYTSTAGGYRDFLYQDLTASGISFTFIGSNTSNATPLLTAAGQTHHNGYGGWTIEDMDANLSGSAAPLYGGDGNAGGYWLTSGSAGGAVVKPTMVLLEAGANDFIKEGSTPLSTIEGYLQKLVTDIHNITPDHHNHGCRDLPILPQ